MKTRDKILLSSLELFNDLGERNVTTNHIAAYLAISPGNLYYHFRNKSDIIYEIFQEYEKLVDFYLDIPEDRPMTLDDMTFYLESVFDGLWSYRFFHRDLEYLLDRDPRLRSDYREFTNRCLSAISRIFEKLADSGIIEPQPESLRGAMSLNVWLVITNWMAYLKTAHAAKASASLSLHELKQGIYQVLTLEIPYLTPAYREQVMSLREQYRPTMPNQEEKREAPVS
ncbi:MAG: AcrR family transcriptional regulator [Marinobacter maritimus]|jgi:AcrR family transcriptional regulator|uniref:TetR/AcrR family transcriptional regulator n=1 Tax=Marinobacter maritimus TaxID=277961 RepID=UPI000BDB7386|nr:TetR/AcrR family transcriptional regulator [Marinobacter maritimus]MBL1271493.1 TetR/AcrR family transcriptional regulator [Oceanospirillales bacterium]|tara:strand:- start:360 stop:1040 length:681 start_codon:yes stop_codon:yes gene_type:complete